MVDFLQKLFSVFSVRERWIVLAILGGIAVAAVLEAAGLGLLLWFIVLLRGGDVQFTNPLLVYLLRMIRPVSGQTLLFRVSLIVLAFYVAKNIYLGALYHVQFRIVYAKQTEMSKELLRRYLHKPYTFHLQRNTAELLKNVTDEVHAVCHNVLVPLLLLVAELLLMLVIVGSLVVVDPIVTVSALGLAAVSGWLVMARVHRTLRSRGEAKQHHLEGMIRWVNQSLGSLKELKVLGRESQLVEIYGRHAFGFSDSLREVAMAHQLPRLLIETMAVGFITLTVVLVGWEQKGTERLIPMLALFGLAAVRLMPSVGRSASMLTMLRYYTSSVDVVARDLGRPAAHGATPATRAVRDVTRLTSELSVVGLSYRYPGADRLALDDGSLRIRQGALVGIIGPSGSGKTTLIDLLLGILEPTAGRILADGLDVHADIRRWQANIGYITQNTYLLDDSIKRNIALGVADADIDDARIWTALRAAQLEAFVAALPDQLDAVIGERGSRISGGERQRLGIARALYHNPDVLVMDEPTSALDYAIEHEVMQAITVMKGYKTIIIVAHRLSTVSACDEIYMVTEGKVTGPIEYERVARFTGASQPAV